MMKYKQEYIKTLIGKEWEDCALALNLQMSECNKKILKHQESIESLKKTIKAYDTVHYKIVGYYLHIKPDCYKEEESEVKE